MYALPLFKGEQTLRVLGSWESQPLLIFRHRTFYAMFLNRSWRVRADLPLPFIYNHCIVACNKGLSLKQGHKTAACAKKCAIKKKIKLCRMDTCAEPAARRTPYCLGHSGPRKCELNGCTKFAQGRTRFCIGHGGGRRCKFSGCTKGARDKQFCVSHGGGRRCRTQDCTKLAVGSSMLCTAHGGGKRCKAPKCSKSAQSSFDYCVQHGGGHRCIVESCTKIARGRTMLCMSHFSKSKQKSFCVPI